MKEKNHEEFQQMEDDLFTYDRMLTILEDEDMKALCNDPALHRVFWQNGGSLEKFVPNREIDYYEKMRLLCRELGRCLRAFDGADPVEWFDKKLAKLLEKYPEC